MQPINIAAPDFEYDPQDPDAYRSAMFRLGPLLGADQLGATVYELPPGQSICPYHYEHAEEEWLVVLVGTRRCAIGRAAARWLRGTWCASRRAPGGRTSSPTRPIRRSAC